MRLELGLFGIKDGVVWVADDAFVTRSAGNVLVEKWVGSRLVVVLVRQDGRGMMQSIWVKLNEIAVDTGWSSGPVSVNS
ncbi:hypothetical protein [Pseudarthrobacter oxydans]|uniref:hypothetical protein n=1 Tax=Pseudarthrobacter oxydans TaxID=1671 RepID=UPI0038005893